jgi:aminoglycoside 3-N-acetyltransferase
MTPERLIRILQDLVGPEGTLLMLTFSFVGKQAYYVASHSHFDAQNTPSQLGALTEVFRKSPGVIRSLHPTHSVSAWGRHANELVTTHHLGPTYGMSSPFYKLREFNGLVIGLGTQYRYGFGPTHVVEELDPKSRALAFESELRKMTIKDGSHEFDYEFRVFRPKVNREYERIANIMLRDKILRYVTVCGLPCLSGNADAFIRRGLELAAENNYIIRAKV